MGIIINKPWHKDPYETSSIIIPAASKGCQFNPKGMVNWHPLGTIWHPLEGPGRKWEVFFLLFFSLAHSWGKWLQVIVASLDLASLLPFGSVTSYLFVGVPLGFFRCGMRGLPSPRQNSYGWKITIFIIFETLRSTSSKWICFPIVIFQGCLRLAWRDHEQRL